MAYTGRMAQMVWGSTPTAQQPVAVAPTPTPNAAAVTTGTSDLFTFGLPTGYTQKDLGDGRYEMFDTSGNSAGYGYKGVRDAIGELSYKNANAKTINANGVWTNPYLQVAKSIWTDLEGKEMDVSGLQRGQVSNDYGLQDAFFKPAPTDVYGNPIGEREQVYARQGEKMVNQEFSSEDEIKKQLEKYKQVGNYNGVMGDWEALGQVLEGNVAPNPQEWGNLPTDQKEQIIKGQGILYGSTPVFSKDGQLIGYRTDLTPNNDAKDFDNGTDTINQEQFGTFITHAGKSHKWANANWRELTDPEAWKNNALFGADGVAFIPKGNEGNLSWTNKDSYSHKDVKKGIVQNIWENTHIGDDLGLVKYKDVAPVIEVAGNIIGGIFAYGIPIGSLMMAADGFTSDNDKAGRSALIRAGVSYAMSYSGSTPPAGSEQAATTAATAEGLSTTAQAVQAVKDAASWFNNLKPADFGINLGSATADKIVFNAAKSAIGSAVKSGLSGQGLEDAVKAAIASTITSLVGGAASVGAKEATSGILGQSGSNIAGTVAGTVAGNLTGSAVRDATADTPDPVSRPTTQKPTVAAPTLSNKYTGSMARMIWS